MINETLIAFARGGGRGGGGLLLILLLAGLAGLAVLLIRRRGGGQRGAGQGAEGILDDRFARGEIDRNEYEHRRAVLAGDDHVPPAPSHSATTIADRPQPDGPEAADDAGSDEA